MKRSCSILFTILSLSFLSLAALSLGGCKEEAVLYQNPVIQENCPDPAVLDNRDRDGWFYLYATSRRLSRGVNDFPVYRSRDLVSWELVGPAFTPEPKPSWEPAGSLWAPEVQYLDGQYVLYYAVGVWGDHDRSASGVAVSDSPTGPFHDRGMLVSRSNTGVGNSIDPACFVDTDGRVYLYWGSLRHATDEAVGRQNGIYVVELTADGLSLKPGAQPVKVAGDYMEGVYVHRHGKYYYLFASEGSCCEADKSTYHVIVGRSTSPLGPFVSRSGMSMIAGDEGRYDGVILRGDSEAVFCGPGHDSGIITDSKGHDWMFYHAYWSGTDYKVRSLNLDQVRWDRDGWPYFQDGVPSASSPAPVFTD